LTCSAEVCTLLNVAEHGKVQDPTEMAVRLEKLVGGRWVPLPRGAFIPGAALVAQFTESESGRWVLSGVLLLGEAITADQLRKIPVATLENSVNLTNQTARKFMDEVIAQLPVLERGDLAPEEFSRRVAEHYRAWAKVVPHPAAEMAGHAGVKAPTVHTWIREARLRGFLPPARRGKGSTS